MELSKECRRRASTAGEGRSDEEADGLPAGQVGVLHRHILRPRESGVIRSFLMLRSGPMRGGQQCIATLNDWHLRDPTS